MSNSKISHLLPSTLSPKIGSKFGTGTRTFQELELYGYQFYLCAESEPRFLTKRKLKKETRIGG
jgi:hypothetical protein